MRMGSKRGREKKALAKNIKKQGNEGFPIRDDAKILVRFNRTDSSFHLQQQQQQ